MALLGRQRLAAAGVEHPEREAEMVLAQCLRWPRAKVLAERQFRPGRQARQCWRRLLGQRLRRVPWQYLAGGELFAGRWFRIGPGVLIPRPETELLLAEARRLAAAAPAGFIADLGTGSGILALSLGAELPQARVVATEISARALHFARLNRRRLGLSNVRCYLGDADRPVPARLAGRFFLVVSNPPYIRRSELAGLQPEVRHEPRQALDGGPDGLRQVEHLAAAAHRLLHPGGHFLCEIGAGQKRRVFGILRRIGFARLTCLADWQQIPRVVMAEKIP